MKILMAMLVFLTGSPYELFAKSVNFQSPDERRNVTYANLENCNIDIVQEVPAWQRGLWGKHDITWKLINFTPDLSHSQVRSLTQKAFKYWSDVTPFVFTETTEAGRAGDIEISFEYIDGPGRVIAHAIMPHMGVPTVKFDDYETFTIGNPAGTDYLQIATHEIGHTLGLFHNTHDQNSVMYPCYRYRSPYGLSSSDIAKIQDLYGKKCKDTLKNCNRNRSFCTNTRNLSRWRRMRKNCKKTCGLC